MKDTWNTEEYRKKVNAYVYAGIHTYIHFPVLLFILQLRCNRCPCTCTQNTQRCVWGAAALRIIHHYLCQRIYFETTSLRDFINEMNSTHIIIHCRYMYFRSMIQLLSCGTYKDWNWSCPCNQAINSLICRIIACFALWF